MSLDNKKIAVLVDNYFEQSEFEEPLDMLREDDADVDIVSTSGKHIQALEHVNMGSSFTADKLIDEIDFNDYDALVLTGGVVNADNLRMNESAREFVNFMMDNSRLVAAICHAPWLLVSADVIDGRNLSSYYSLQDDIRNAGGEWINQEVVIDDNLITSRKPEDIPAFVGAIKQWLQKVEQLN